MIRAFAQDLRSVIRLLWRSPGFAAVCIGTIALAIGANTAIFSVVHGVMLKALPFADPGRLVVLGHHTNGGDALDSTTPGNLYDWMRGATAFEAMAGFAPTERIVSRPDGAERIRGGLSVGPLFEVLGRQAAEGRALSAADDDPGAPRVVVLSARLARRLFGAAQRGRPVADHQRRSAHRRRRDAARFRLLRLRLRVLGAGAFRRGVPRQPRPVLPGRAGPARARRRHRPGDDPAQHGDGRHPPRLPAVHPERGGRRGAARGGAARRRAAAARAADGRGRLRPAHRLRQPRQPAAGARRQPPARDGGAPGARRRAGAAGAPGAGRIRLAGGRGRRGGAGASARACCGC